jgi:hypothetical protein
MLHPVGRTKPIIINKKFKNLKEAEDFKKSVLEEIMNLWNAKESNPLEMLTS